MSNEEYMKSLSSRLQKETDPDVLKAIEILLTQDTKEARVKRRLMEGAILSEQDIKEGRVHSWDDVKSEVQAMINERRKNKGSKRA